MITVIVGLRITMTIMIAVVIASMCLVVILTIVSLFEKHESLAEGTLDTSITCYCQLLPFHTLNSY